nr:alpha- and gamma-adaptin-binding protein p34-like [Onthophagus taurus]
MSEDLSKPSVLIVSSSSTKPKSLLKLITKETVNLSESVDKVSTSWILDTKYYKANVNVHGITKDYKRDSEFNSSVEALIIHIDTNKESGLDDLKVWQDLDDECNPEIKLLIANYCNNDTKISKPMAIEWCLRYGYELIELYPNNEDNLEQNDEIIKEKVGVERIVEALQSHIWPNLVMKSKEIDKPLESNENNAENKLGVNKDLDNLLNGIDSCMSQMDDFTNLFSKLQSMKESIQSLPHNERKLQAEEMVTAFWRAIGGDEDEIDFSDL